MMRGPDLRKQRATLAGVDECNLKLNRTFTIQKAYRARPWVRAGQFPAGSDRGVNGFASFLDYKFSMTSSGAE
jgi:hypothetical protein